MRGRNPEELFVKARRGCKRLTSKPGLEWQLNLTQIVDQEWHGGRIGEHYIWIDFTCNQMGVVIAHRHRSLIRNICISIPSATFDAILSVSAMPLRSTKHSYELLLGFYMWFGKNVHSLFLQLSRTEANLPSVLPVPILCRTFEQPMNQGHCVDPTCHIPPLIARMLLAVPKPRVVIGLGILNWK